jgi:o-succinylbenzoate synthase
MRIDTIALHRVRMPLVAPFRTAFGDTAAIESVLVRIASGGLSGWGETCPWAAPAYSPEWAAGAFALLRDWLAPRLLGKDIASGEHLQRELAPFKGNPFAKAGLDLAWWDLHARQLNRPLWDVIGGRSDTVEVGADFGVMDSLDLLLEAIRGAVAAGFKRIKLKYRPGWELDMVAAVRRAFPDTVFHVDCNSAYTLRDAGMLQALDDFNLAMIEQPLAHDDLHDHAALQAMLRTPICLDESICSAEKARQAIALKACGWINIKPGRVGGITPALAIHELCRQAGVPVWIGGMLESAVGSAHCLALAALPNVRYPSDVFPSPRFYARDLAEPELALAGPSRMRAFPGPGIGCAPRPDALSASALEHVTLNAPARARPAERSP